MGCHSWFYQPWDTIPHERKENIFNRIKEEIADKKRYYFSITEGNYLEEYYNILKEIYGFTTKEEVEEKLLSQRHYEGMSIEDIKNKLLQHFIDCKNNFINTLRELELIEDWHLIEDPEIFYQLVNRRGIDFVLVGDRYWIKTREDDDAFRVCNYPEEEFSDSEELIKWLYENQEKLRPYFYRDGNMITDLEEISTLIRDLWKKYNNKLFVRFG